MIGQKLLVSPWLIIALCALPFQRARAQLIPETGESVVSDAIGFGALKILARTESIRDELGLDVMQTQSLNDLLERSFKRFEYLDQPSMERWEVIKQLDAWVDAQISEILGEDKATAFAHSVVTSKLHGEQEFALLFHKGVAEYLECEREIDLLKQELIEFHKRATNGPNTTYIDHHDDIANLTKAAIEVERKIANADREFTASIFKKFVNKLNESQKDRLSRLIQVDKLH